MESFAGHGIRETENAGMAERRGEPGDFDMGP
jgi:hypothetical protein